VLLPDNLTRAIYFPKYPMNKFKIFSKFKPQGDQPKAIKELTKGIKNEQKIQTLLGVTGSGKTFTIANVIEKIQRPTLVIAPNKTLAAQLAQEFRIFFPKNAVEYFVSYYDYYQPEAYISSTDTYIEKESQINDEIDRLRHSATASLLSRQDVIICASVSCIYGLGSPEYYQKNIKEIKIGENFQREKTISDLVKMQYLRSDILERGKFRLSGNVLEIMMPGRETIVRIETEKEKTQKIFEYNPATGQELGTLEKVFIYPAKHFVAPEEIMKNALEEIEKEMEAQIIFFKNEGKILEAERISRRTRQDLEMMREIGYCNGIENYSRYLTGRAPGEAPFVLLDYFPQNFFLVVDESHVSIPQLNGMYNGDRARKFSLVENGFRLPSALDNRPLKFEEFEKKVYQTVFVSATPGKYELEKSRISYYKNKKISKLKNFAIEIKIEKKDQNIKKTKIPGIVEQIIRPTGLIDPEILTRSAKTQIKDLKEEIEKIIKRKERVLVTTLTKKQAENLAEYLKELKIKTEYLHSGVNTLDRIKTLENLRRGKIDVLVGVNLLREGLDLPEVSLVAILDADKEGFLRSETSLIQTIGRAARNVRGKVILYADIKTGSMKRAIDETNRRRALQLAYNKKNKITPKTIQKKIISIVDHEINPQLSVDFSHLEAMEDIAGYIKQREREMKEAGRNLEFERAMVIRDEIRELRKLQFK